MAVVVTNVGVYERDTSGIRTTSTVTATKTGALSGTVRSVYQGIEYVFGPGESKTFADHGIASGVIAGSEKGLGTGN